VSDCRNSLRDNPAACFRLRATAQADFFHLHVLSNYSLLDGACRLDEVVAKACALQIPSLAITVHAVLRGVIDSCQTARITGIKFLRGGGVDAAFPCRSNTASVAR
jgi:DNA polymerase-3 subunit alpha